MTAVTTREIDGVKEVVAIVLMDTLSDRKQMLASLDISPEFAEEQGIKDRLEEVLADDSLNKRAQEFVNARHEAGEVMLYEPVEITRLLYNLAELAYILNDDGTRTIYDGTRHIWETVVLDGFVISGYPVEGYELITEMLDAAGILAGNITDPIDMLELWGEAMNSHIQNYSIDELLANLGFDPEGAEAEGVQA